MPALTINLEGDNAWEDLKGKPIIHLADQAPRRSRWPCSTAA
jgi:hypothetical protein